MPIFDVKLTVALQVQATHLDDARRKAEKIAREYETQLGLIPADFEADFNPPPRVRVDGVTPCKGDTAN